MYDRDTQEVVASAEFLPDDPGTANREDGELVGGSRFLVLSPPLTLPTGFRGTMVADGYGEMERLRNLPGLALETPWTTRDGNGSLSFVGVSRYGEVGVFPATLDAGPAARYGAGTFIFETTPPLLPGAPLARLQRPRENHAATLVWPAVTLPLPAARYQVLRADAADGPFVQIADIAAWSYRDADLPNGIEKFYRVRAVAVGGQTGPESDTL